MSLRGKEVRPFIAPDLHDKLTAIADFRQTQLAELAGRLLEKAIVAEWHEFKDVLDRASKTAQRLNGGH